METGAGCISGVGVLQARLWNLEAAGSNPEATGSNPEATGSNPRFASFLPLLFFFLEIWHCRLVSIYAHEMDSSMYTTDTHYADTTAICTRNVGKDVMFNVTYQ